MLVSGFPGCTSGKEHPCQVKNLPASAREARDLGLILKSGRLPGGGNDNPLQYSCVENPMDRGAWQTIDHGVAELNMTY